MQICEKYVADLTIIIFIFNFLSKKKTEKAKDNLLMEREEEEEEK